MAGHVFIVHGDLLRLHCDAWLLPTNPALSIEPEWRRDPHGVRPAWTLGPDQAWPVGAPRVAPLGDQGDGPQPWLVDVVGDDGQVLEAAVAGARGFLREAAARFGGRAPYTGRERPLLALPVVGTGAAGATSTAGDILGRLLGVLERDAAALDVDVALVCLEGALFAAAQEVRRRSGRGWPLLGGALEAEARALVDRSGLGALVVFLGAGVSAGAGLPLRGELLDRIAEGVVTEGERADFRALDPLDRARILRQRLGAELPKQAAALVAGRHHSLAHALLAGLPVSEVVTTNYDTLFELAAAGAGRPVSVLPWERPQAGGRWLLKLHGCAVREPEQIVLTRQDFLRHIDRDAALSGVVQSLLITRHMLFVGFSLDDESFHRIADAVRKAVRRDEAAAGGERFGTVVELFDNPLKSQLWDRDLYTVAMGRGLDEARPSHGEATRRLEIFLDAISCFSANGTPYLLDDRFVGLRSEGEEALRDQLVALAEGLAADRGARETPGGQRVAAFLRALGYTRDPGMG